MGAMYTPTPLPLRLVYLSRDMGALYPLYPLPLRLVYLSRSDLQLAYKASYFIPTRGITSDRDRAKW